MRARIVAGAVIAVLVAFAGSARAGAMFYGAEEAKLAPTSAAAGDHFGYSVAAASDTALVGGYGRNAQAGSAYVFARSGGTWALQAELTPPTLVKNAGFGSSVALSETGDTAVVGAPGEGAAYVFVRAAGKWSQQAKITTADATADDRFGLSVSISNDSVIVGAPQRAGKTGAAYVFVRSGSTWTQQAGITGKDAGAYFGYAVAISGDTAFAGAPFADAAIGRVFVAVRSGGTWSEGPKLSAVGGDEVTGAGFGLSIALGPDKAIVGANGIGGETGAAYVLARSGTTWMHEAKLTAADGKPGDNFGAVALCGETAVVGAFHRSGDAGGAYAFRSIGGKWTQLPTMVASDAMPGALLGESVACAGDLVIAGADGKSTGRGGAYAFRITATKAAGGACALGYECASGYCADGTCCEGACAGAVCAKDSECPMGFTCVDAKCVQNTAGAACSEDHSKSISTSGTTECAPYVCVDSPGTCLDTCSASGQCAPGFLCDGTKCVASAADPSSDGGCRLGASTALAPFALLGLLGAALALRRRTTSTR